MKFWLIATLFLPGLVLAQELNTGVLPTLWYSKTNVQEGDQIKIYGGIQNHSGVKFSGIAVWSVDGGEIKSSPFVSEPDTLIELEADWQATYGDHKIELRITDLKPPASAIWSESTGQIELSIKKKITPELVKEKAEGIALTVVEKIDETANGLAETVREYKENLGKPELGAVMGTTTESAFENIAKHPAAISAFGLVLAFLSALLRHWQWTLGALSLFSVYLAFRPKP